MVLDCECEETTNLKMQKWVLALLVLAAGCVAPDNSALMQPYVQAKLHSIRVCDEAKNQAVDPCLDAVRARCGVGHAPCAQMALAHEPACQKPAAQSCIKSLAGASDYWNERCLAEQKYQTRLAA
jgi:hypothetical protein